MQIILLCGGGGTRLWPLSNQTRSKQFIKLFKAPDGTSESMFQRVIRQIRESKLNAKINIATSQSQVDSVVAQGGENISIITEPDRRDTFPAIALSTLFLSKVKGVDDGEVVVVMPCDPYTDSGYFDAIFEMVGAVESKMADLILMGIEPTEPSTKYGYIMPSAVHVGMVDYFIEKPDGCRAKALIDSGALWNGGVFAFKLGYLRRLISKYSNQNNFEDVLANYDEFPKISFDYEVVEKAKSVGVVKYSGRWKDLGTWASFCEELPGDTHGLVYSDYNESTTIVNELSLPIISRGCSNIIIAASPDGILVADKDSAEAIKQTVKAVSNRPMYEERRWGNYRVLDSMSFPDGSAALTKRLVLSADNSTSHHRHLHREEILTIVNGVGEVVVGTEQRKVIPGDTVFIPMGVLHSLKAITKLTIIEVQRGNQLIEEDTERFDYIC